MSSWIKLPQHFNFDDLLNEARAGRFDPEALVQSVALDMSQTQFVGIGVAACLKALALRYQDGWPEGECLAMRHGGQDCISQTTRLNTPGFRMARSSARKQASESKWQLAGQPAAT